MAYTASDMLFDALEGWSVEVVFGLPGDGINALMEALRKRQDRLRFVQVRMVLPPRDPWSRRYWGYYNRPYPGIGCLYTILLIFFIWLLVSLFFQPFWFW